MDTGLRWLFYAPNGFGLGHVTRTLALARQIRHRSADAEVLFLTDCETTNVIWHEGFTSVKLPSFHAVEHGFIERARAEALAQAIVRGTFAAFQPEVLVVDAFPNGRADELTSVLATPAKRVFIFQERKQALREDPKFIARLKRYDVILSPYWKDEVELPTVDGVPVEWTGPIMIRSRQEVMPQAEARRRLDLPTDGFVVYVAYGGGGHLQYEQFLKTVWQQASSYPQWTFACPVAPLLRKAIPVPPLPNVRTFSYYPVAEIWSAFDGAITALGNNTAMELLYNGVPSVFIPWVDMDDDQVARGRRIAKAGAGWVANTVSEIVAAVRQLSDPEKRLQVSDRAKQAVPENGAERAAQVLLEWLGRKALS